MSDTAEETARGSRSASDPSMRAILEALLYASPGPVTLDELKEAFGDERAAEVEAALKSLVDEYAAPGRGLMIERVGGGYRIVTRPGLAEVLREFVQRRNRTRLSRAALETLSVVAYRQPVTAPEIEAIRGVNPSAILRSLLDRRLVRISGRKKVVGKPFLYATTPEFLLHFGLNTLDDLPSMEEFAGMLDKPAAPAPVQATGEASRPTVRERGDQALQRGRKAEEEE